MEYFFQLKIIILYIIVKLQKLFLDLAIFSTNNILS